MILIIPPNLPQRLASVEEAKRWGGLGVLTADGGPSLRASLRLYALGIIRVAPDSANDVSQSRSHDVNLCETAGPYTAVLVRALSLTELHHCFPAPFNSAPSHSPLI